MFVQELSFPSEEAYDHMHGAQFPHTVGDSGASINTVHQPTPTGGLIHHHNTAAADQCPADAQQLPLAHTETPTVLAQLHVEATHPADFLGELQPFQDLPNFSFGALQLCARGTERNSSKS